MAKTSKIVQDQIPYRAGIVVAVPLDINNRPDYTKAVATTENFLASTQLTTSRTMENVETGNGGNMEFANTETHTLAITGNTFSPIFHATIAGQIEEFPQTTLVPDRQEVTLPTEVADGEDLKITFGSDGMIKKDPGADADGKYNFIVNDSYGNDLVRTDGTPEKGSYKYDADTKAIILSDDYKGASMRIVYWYADTDAVTYRSNPIIQNKRFLIQALGLTQDDKGNTYKVVETLARATVSGDLTEQPKQVSRSAQVSYSFVTAPVPVGTSAYTKTITLYQSADGTDGSGADTNANGVDDAGLNKT